MSVPSNLLLGRGPAELLDRARQGMVRARLYADAHHWGMAYAAAHLAALRGGAALVAARAVPGPTDHGVALPGVWVLLAQVAAGEPEPAAFGSWFAAHTAGPHPPDRDATAQMVGMATEWLAYVAEAIGAPVREG